MKSLLYWMATLIFAVVSGLQVVQQTQEVRFLNAQLQNAQRGPVDGLFRNQCFLVQFYGYI